jgi:hypothetical protein
MNVGLFHTSFEYNYDLSVYYNFMVGLRAIYDCRSGLSAGHDYRVDCIAIYDNK